MGTSLQTQSSFRNYFLFFTKRLRLSKPWKFKAPFLISIPYFVLLLSLQENKNSFFAILASICIIVGVAGIGYLTNDLGDRQKDQLIQKENVTASMSAFNMIFLFILFFGLALAPWFYLPLDRTSFFLLVFQFVLFFVYAFPPFRLKEKGLPGLITDALYVHVNPAILAAYTFYLFSGSSAPHFLFFLILLSGWQFLLGMRNIIFHQLEDVENDLQSGTRTFVTIHGKERVTGLVKRLILPLEVFLLVAFTIIISILFNNYVLMIGTVGYWIILRIKTGPEGYNSGFRKFAYIYLDDLRNKWIPLFILVALVIRSVHFLPILVLHFILFRSDIKTELLNLFRRFSNFFRHN